MVKSKSQFKYTILGSVSLMILLTLSGHASARPIPANCRALIEMRNDLWFIKADNSAPFQVTRDGKQKFTIGGVSPDGKMIAYLDQPLAPGVSQIDKEEITLIDLTGKLLSKINLHTQGGIDGLTWTNTNFLQVAEHVGPKGSIFHFVEVPSGGLHPILLQGLPTAKGSSCTPSPNYRNMACVLGDAAIYFNDSQDDDYLLNDDKRGYTVTGAFVSATELQTLNIAVGSAVTTTTVPPLKLEVLEIVDNQPKLKVTVSGEYSQEEYIRPGDTMSVSVDTDSPDEAPPTIYGFTATIKHLGHDSSGAEDASKDKGDKKPMAVTVRVLKSVTGEYSLEGDLAWSPNGRRIATVEKNGLGQRWLVLLNSKVSDGKGDDRGDDQKAGGNIDAREPLPIKGPISRIEFTLDTHIRVEGSTQIFEQDIPAYGKLPGGTKYTITPALPKQFSIGDMFVPVYGWVCQ